MLNDALAGNQKAFGRFLKLLNLSGLKRAESSFTVKNHYYESKVRRPRRLSGIGAISVYPETSGPEQRKIE
jgi:hypothetical protein